MGIARWVVGLGLVAAVAGGAYAWTSRPLPVTVASPTRGTAAEVVYAAGVVEPRRWAKVTTVVRRHIIDLCHCEGQPVIAGQILGRLDDQDARAAMRELEAREQFAKGELDRAVDLLERRVTSQQAYERASAELGQVRAALAAARAKLDDYILRAPLEGIVLRRDGEVGEVAEPGQILFWVGNPKPLEVVADVNEEDIPKVQAGQSVLLRSDAFPDRPVTATVASITPKGDPVAKTYRVRLALPDDAPFLVGMSVDVNIIVRTVDSALKIPRGALDGAAVMVVRADQTAERVALKIGIRGAREVEVIEGLPADARVIVPYPVALKVGQRVAPTVAPAER